MTRRTRLQSKTDDLAFPVRVKFLIPSNGLGARINDIRIWLRDEIGTGRYAWHSAQAIAGEAVAVYFLNLADAQRFADTFPSDLTLADGTLSPAYYSPYKGGPARVD